MLERKNVKVGRTYKVGEVDLMMELFSGKSKKNDSLNKVALRSYLMDGFFKVMDISEDSNIVSLLGDGDAVIKNIKVFMSDFLRMFKEIAMLDRMEGNTRYIHNVTKGATVCMLKDGTTAVAHLKKEDTYSFYTGERVSFLKANVKENKKEIDRLEREMRVLNNYLKRLEEKCADIYYENKDLIENIKNY